MLRYAFINHFQTACSNELNFPRSCRQLRDTSYNEQNELPIDRYRVTLVRAQLNILAISNISVQFDTS